MKKMVSLFSSLALTTGVLAGCGPDGETTKTNPNEGNKQTETSENSMPPKPDKLVVWEDVKRGVALEPAIKAFEEKYGIKVEYKEVEMATKQREQLRLDGPAGTGPDVITVPHDQIGQLVTEGLIREIHVDPSVLDQFTESSIQAETYKGKLYGLPKAVETPVFIYNKKLMDKAPETMDELYQFAKGFTKGDKYGFLALWDNFYFAHGVIAGMGGYVFKEDNGTLDPKNLGLNNDGAVKGAEYIQKWYKELFPKGIIGENGGSTMDGLFNEGKVASVMNGPWAFQGTRDAGIEIGVAPMPTLPNGEHMKTLMGVKGWHVSAFSKNPEWATKLIEFLTNEESAKKRFELTKEIPPVKSLVDDPLIAEDEGAKAVAIQSQYAVPMPNIPEMSEVWGPMATALQLVANQKIKPKKALDEAVKTIQTNIETNHSGE
jgi:arabinogalactan oligomer / maltooligosaccharide transport system substrate-binding protein